MATVYFVRHAESDNKVREDAVRPLTKKGLADCRLVTEFLQNKDIAAVFSSPYKRAVDTIADFAKSVGLPIEIVNDFREREFGGVWVDDFRAFAEKQWNDFLYEAHNGESLAKVQARNVAALKQVLAQNPGKNIVIGTHGTALSTIINYYDNTYGFEDFMAMVNIMPWIVVMHFDCESGDCVYIDRVDLFAM